MPGRARYAPGPADALMRFLATRRIQHARPGNAPNKLRCVLNEFVYGFARLQAGIQHADIDLKLGRTTQLVVEWADSAALARTEVPGAVLLEHPMGTKVGLLSFIVFSLHVSRPYTKYLTGPNHHNSVIASGRTQTVSWFAD